MRGLVWQAALGLLLAAARPLAAQEPEDVDVPEEEAAEEPEAEEPEAKEPAGEESVAPAAVERRLQALEEENEALREELEYLREDLDYERERVEDLLPVKGEISGYLDFGFFAVAGDGSGIREDFGHAHFPEFMGVVEDFWTFMGDPLSTAINARGDPAETAASRAVVFDGVGAGDNPSFIVNTLDLQLFAALGDSLTLTSFIDFVPRSRDVSDPDGLFLGDFVDVKLAYAEYLAPVDAFRLSVFAGKFDSVVGFEYRTQEAPDRLSVSPSLICRYVCGRPLGLKARGGFFDDLLIANVSLTNGSHFTEHFGFADEIDSNALPTAAGRLSVSLPFATRLLIGVSGAYGPQDAQPDRDVIQWHVGGDLHLELGNLIFTAEYVKGRAEGGPTSGDFSGVDDCSEAPCLRYQGAYGLTGYRLTNVFVPYARVDWRDALHRDGASFVYISALWRATLGLRLEIGAHVIIKGEYTVNRELGEIPQFPNDFFTSSLVLRY